MRRPFIVDLIAYCAVRFVRALTTMGGLIDGRAKRRLKAEELEEQERAEKYARRWEENHGDLISEAVGRDKGY